jgi:hypothetical protein
VDLYIHISIYQWCPILLDLFMYGCSYQGSYLSIDLFIQSLIDLLILQPSLYIWICLAVYLCTALWIYQTMGLPTNLPTYVSIDLLISLSTYLSVYESIYVSIHCYRSMPLLN